MTAKRVRRRQTPKNHTDNGTPEMQRMRKMLVGHENDQRASYPLGVMLARNIITQAEHDAAVHYAHVVQKATGRWQSNEGGISLDPDSEAAAKSTLKAELAWKEYAAKLLAQGRQIKDAIDNLAIYSRFPRWLIRLCLNEPLSPSDAAHVKKIVAGIASMQKGVDGIRQAA